MSRDRDNIRKMLDELPDDISLNVQYHLYVRQKIAGCLDDLQHEHVVDREELERRFEQWLK